MQLVRQAVPCFHSHNVKLSTARNACKHLFPTANALNTYKPCFHLQLVYFTHTSHYIKRWYLAGAGGSYVTSFSREELYGAKEAFYQLTCFV
eukprot:scaffold27930_cov46-Prasinocladus_malaysianus.AAC.2